MNYEHQVFIHQFPLVKRFVYHLIYYRALLEGYKKHQLQNEFWTLTIDAHLLRAAINWCMVFGSDKSVPTHSKRLSITDSKALYQSFREGLFEATDLNRIHGDIIGNAWSLSVTNTLSIGSRNLKGRSQNLIRRSPSHTITTPG